MDTYIEKASKPIKRLNATLPEPLARFVGAVTGEGGLYETPSELVRDLIRRYMERLQQSDIDAINAPCWCKHWKKIAIALLPLMISHTHGVK